MEVSASSTFTPVAPQDFEAGADVADVTLAQNTVTDSTAAASLNGAPAARSSFWPHDSASYAPIALQLMQPPVNGPDHIGVTDAKNAAASEGSGLQLSERFSNSRGFKTNADANAYETFMRTGKELFGDKFIQQAIRAGDLPGGPGDLVIGLVGGGKGGQQAIRAADDAAYLVERTLLGGVRKIGPLRELEVGTYKELDSIRRTFGTEGVYHIDHIPSQASLRIAMEKELGRKLSDDEIRQIGNDGIGVAIRRDMHLDSRTYAGRNNALKIIDAANLHEVVRKDLTVFIDNAAARGIGEYDIMKTVSAIIMKNRQEGLIK